MNAAETHETNYQESGMRYQHSSLPDPRSDRAVLHLTPLTFKNPSRTLIAFEIGCRGAGLAMEKRLGRSTLSKSSLPMPMAQPWGRAARRGGRRGPPLV